MITRASTPWVTSALTSEIDFWRSPPPISTICSTLAHFAASERTAAIDACDHGLTPKPSWMPSRIGSVPQKDVSSVLPAAAMISSAVVGAAAALALGATLAPWLAGATEGAAVAADDGEPAGGVVPQAVAKSAVAA